MKKIITAVFDGKGGFTIHGRLWQYDYGQILRIQGLSLPSAVEIHFSLESSGGDAVTRIGLTADGVTDVVIPDSLLENDDVDQSYYIYALVYLTDDESGSTAYAIQIYVTARAKPEAILSAHVSDTWAAVRALIEECLKNAKSTIENAALAEKYSILAEEAAAGKGYFFVEGRDDGYLWFIAAENVDEITMYDDGEGGLIVNYGG